MQRNVMLSLKERIVQQKGILKNVKYSQLSLRARLFLGDCDPRAAEKTQDELEVEKVKKIEKRRDFIHRYVVIWSEWLINHRKHWLKTKFSDRWWFAWASLHSWARWSIALVMLWETKRERRKGSQKSKRSIGARKTSIKWTESSWVLLSFQIWIVWMI